MGMGGLKKMALLDAQRRPPAWLRRLRETKKFFEPCSLHAGALGRSTRSAGSCNYFCTSCDDGGALCSGCLADHAGHEIIQIRRSSSHCLVKVADLRRLLNVSYVQTYMINGEPGVFLDKRALPGKAKKPAANKCTECNRGLNDADCLFCSLGCKANGIEDLLDFNITFAVDPRGDSSGEESESESETETETESSDDDDTFLLPTKSRKLGTSPGSPRQVTARGRRSR
ncbi:hypothetical protein PVAP13_1KG101662 [Panicum virgatum]|uniref:PLATZ transcription factor family protein n=1 Tax=Panicum virgatum TaxID=38727 RepID=A0A8T0XCZ8_PANVG|nr:hypothetical protein PVAP13_1KG100908 [Panicum virgatum]KAG2656648.1 hypothetical protein PVAP13_1KG101662 [Panicum virgatum]